MSATQILHTRAHTHGDFATNSEVSQRIKAVMRSAPGWHDLSFAQKEALELIALKIGRIVAGNPDFLDHWADIAGYAELGGKGRFRPESPKTEALKSP